MFKFCKLISSKKRSPKPWRETKHFFFFCFHRDSVWSVLAGSATESASSIVIHDVKEIETWILRLLSSPVPIPNSTRIEVSFFFCSSFEEVRLF